MANHFENADHTSVGEPLPWFAVHVRSNFERKTGDSLACRGHEVYIPEYTIKRYGRANGSPKPLLPGYVLCRINLNHRLPVLSAPGVIGIVGCGRIPIPLEEEQVRNVKAMAESGLDAAPCTFLKTGDAVVVKSGPLAGLRGYLMQVKNAFQVVVSVEMLQRSIAAELGWDAIGPVNTVESSYSARPHMVTQATM